jgi:hypothetical protein
MSNELLRALVDLRDRQIQKARIQFGNRVDAIMRGADNGYGKQFEIATKWALRFDELESELDRDIAKQVKHYAIYDHVSALRGIGPLLSAKLIAMIDIERSPHVSSLWRYAGYAVMNGERERPVKGEKLHYNKRLKTACYLIASSFLKSGSPYREIYDQARGYYEVNRPDWTKGHQHNAAMRKMTKRFLSHLWLQWRTLEGLPVTEPYVQEKMGHVHIDRPEDYGWPEIATARMQTKETERAIGPMETVSR